MKKKLTTLLCILTLTFSGLQAQSDVFRKLSDHKDITTVYISKALLGMAPNMKLGTANVAGLMDKLEMLEIYTSESPEASGLIKRETENLTTKEGYEVLMKVKDGKEHVTFYVKKEKDVFKDLIMLVDEKKEATMIRAIGSFTPEDIRKVVEN